MKRLTVLFVVALLLVVVPVQAQKPATEAEIRALVPYSSLKAKIPNLSLQDYNRIVRELAQDQGPAVPTRRTTTPSSIGRLSTNPYLPDSTSNQFGSASRFAPESPTNPYGRYGSRYSANGTRNPYATRTPELYSQDGKYLGKLSTNPYDPESVSNPYGKYGSRYSPDSINNPFGTYGSRFSSQSPWNPFASKPPLIVPPKK